MKGHANEHTEEEEQREIDRQMGWMRMVGMAKDRHSDPQETDSRQTDRQTDRLLD